MPTTLSNIVLLFTLSLLISSCGSKTSENESTSNDIPNEKNPKIEFEKQSHEFGRIISGERVSYAFRFTNAGNAPLLITGVRTGCGCTVGDYPREPVMPGKEGRITVVFNSQGRNGFQSETVRVFTNTEPSVVNLTVQSEVLVQ